MSAFARRASRSAPALTLRDAALLSAAPACRGLTTRPAHATRLRWTRRIIPGYLQQVDEEMLAFADFVAAHRPERIGEIGTLHGGTSLFLCGVSPSIRSFVGIDLEPRNARLVDALSPSAVRTVFLQGSSRDAGVRKQFSDELEGQLLDLLFIDGDHTYEGVRADLLEYRACVRPGGVIAFHDIVPDHGRQPCGRSEGWSGGAPIFWKEIRDRFRHREFVSDWNQDGCGIGVIEHDPSRRVGD